MTQPSRPALVAENARLRRKCAQWEMATLALISSNLDAATLARVQARIRELVATAGAES